MAYSRNTRQDRKTEPTLMLDLESSRPRRSNGIPVRMASPGKAGPHRCEQVLEDRQSDVDRPVTQWESTREPVYDLDRNARELRGLLRAGPQGFIGLDRNHSGDLARIKRKCGTVSRANLNDSPECSSQEFPAVRGRSC